MNKRRGTRQRRRNAFVSALICAALVTSACGSGDSDSKPSAAGSATDAAAAPAPVGAEATTPGETGETPGSTPEGGAAPAGTPASPSTALEASPASRGASQSSSAPQSSSGAAKEKPAAASTPKGPAAQRESAAPVPAPVPGPGPKVPAPVEPDPGKKSEIVLGSFGIETGVLASVTGPAPPAIRAWVADVNARGGLNGHPVRMVMADDGADPSKAQAIVRKLVEQEQAIAIFYPYGIDTADAVLPYLESKGVPLLGGLSTDPGIEKSPIGFNPFTTGGPGITWMFLLNLSTLSTKKNVGFITCREVTQCAGQRDAVKAKFPYKDYKWVWDAQVSLAQPDYTAECLSAKQAGAEVIMLGTDTPTTARFLRSCKRQGYTPSLLGVHQAESASTAAFGEELKGAIFGARTKPFDSPELADYRAAVKKYQPKGDMGGFGSSAWVMGKLFEKRIAPLLSDTPTSKEIIDAMYSLKNETLDGLLPGITFSRSKKDNTRTNLCTIPLRLEPGKFVPHDAAASFVCAPDWKPGE